MRIRAQIANWTVKLQIDRVMLMRHGTWIETWHLLRSISWLQLLLVRSTYSCVPRSSYPCMFLDPHTVPRYVPSYVPSYPCTYRDMYEGTVP